MSVPSKVSVDSPYERIIGRLGSDCSDSGEDWASWDIRHSYYGPSDLFFFDTGETSNVWGFYDWDHLGKYYVEPGNAYDYDSNELSQNSRTVSVRLASRLALSTSRSGKYVTLKATARRYSPNADAFRAWKGKPVTLSYKKCSSCGWQILKTRTTNSDGKVSYKVYASKARYWRAQASDSSNTWGRTSATSRR